MFIKIQVLKPQRPRSKCTYGVTLLKGYSQVVRWWQGWCLHVQCVTLWGSLRPSSSTPTRVDHQLRHRNFSVPTKKTIPVYAHLGAHATLSESSPEWKIVTVTYECTEPPPAVLPPMALYVTGPSGTSSATTASSREPLEIKHKK